MNNPGSDSSVLTRFLAQTQARCPRCRYDLRGAESGSCPECGLSLQLSLRAAHTCGGLWWAAIISMSFTSIVLFFFFADHFFLMIENDSPRNRLLIAAGAMARPNATSWTFVIAAAIGVVITVACIGWLIGQRDRIARYSSLQRWLIFVPMISAPLLLVAAVYLLLRI